MTGLSAKDVPVISFIAEAGVNHNGSLELAKRLVEVAVTARVDAVKFQKRSINDILIADVLNQIYDSPTALGATCLERHITLDGTAYGADQAASLEPQGLFRLVRDMRVIEQALGNGVKRVYDSEKSNLKRRRFTN